MSRVEREMPIHLAVLQYLRLRFPGAVIHHSPNEASLKGPAVARMIAKNRNMGMVKGFPDLLVLDDGEVMGFEVKAEGGRLTDSQKDVGEQFAANGCRWAVVRSVVDVEECLAEWGSK